MTTGLEPSVQISLNMTMDLQERDSVVAVKTGLTFPRCMQSIVESSTRSLLQRVSCFISPQ